MLTNQLLFVPYVHFCVYELCFRNCCSLLWALVHLTAGAFIGLILVQAYQQYSTHPLVTTLADTLHPVGRVPFPAISVCSNNRVARSRAAAYAAELQVKTPDRSSITQSLKLC